jgi:hypothetical protein
MAGVYHEATSCHFVNIQNILYNIYIYVPIRNLTCLLGNTGQNKTINRQYLAAIFETHCLNLVTISFCVYCDSVRSRQCKIKVQMLEEIATC